MRLAISSVLGHPRDSRTWSSAPANLANALENHGFDIVPIDSSPLPVLSKAGMAMKNVVGGYPWNGVSWFSAARTLRGEFVAQQARAAGADHVLTTGTLDAPLDTGLRYSVWLDNTWNLLRHSRFPPSFSAAAFDEVDRLDDAT